MKFILITTVILIMFLELLFGQFEDSEDYYSLIPIDEIILKSDLLEYAEECCKDTIELDEIIDTDRNIEFINSHIDFDVPYYDRYFFSELINDMSYKIIGYKNGYIYLIKEKNIEGFTEWLKPQN